MDKQLFGKNIVTLRKSIKMSQQQLADKLGVTTQAVSKWERGVGMPSMDLFIKMIELFGVKADTIIEEEIK